MINREANAPLHDAGDRDGADHATHRMGTLSVSDAQAVITNYVQPLEGTEQVALRDALGRVLAVNATPAFNVPPFDNSAMDGYAFCSADLKLDEDVTLSVVGTAFAGAATVGTVASGECLRIMTGAAMPEGSDTVIPQELTKRLANAAITFPSNVLVKGANRRLAGEDLKAGVPAIMAGTVIGAAQLGLMASMGVAEVSVYRRLRVAFFSTGNELRSIGESIGANNVYDSNRYTVLAMLLRLGCDAIDLGVIQDDPVALESAFRNACENADVVITSGGVSVGHSDHTRQVLFQLGDVVFWKINMRPGRPMAFGTIESNRRSAILLGLPGNPVAAMTAFYFIARPALLRMMGALEKPLPVLRVATQSRIQKKPGRTEYQRGILIKGSNGETQVKITGHQGSGILRSMSDATCIVVLSEERASVEIGEEVEIVVFDGLV